MAIRSLNEILTFGVFTTAALLTFSAQASLQDRRDSVRLPSGQHVTPTAIKDSVQHYLNPGLSAYPEFIAGMAVRSRLSPDGTTLAILTAGQNSLYKPDGTVDVPNSTQYIFLYDVAGANKGNPALKQVIKQVNSHVGLVFSPDGNTLYAAGGSDDVVHVYAKSDGSFTAAGPIPLGHFPPGSTGSARNKGIGIGVQPNASGLDISADGKTLVVANNYNDSISVIDTTTRTVRYEHDLRPYFVRNEGQSGLPGGTFPYGVAMKGNGTAYVSCDRDREVVVVDVSSLTEGRLCAYQARWQRTGAGARRIADPALRRAGQRRSGSRHRYGAEPDRRQDRCTGAGAHAAQQVHRRGNVRGHAVSGRLAALRGEQRLQFDRGDPLERPERAPGDRVDSNRL